MGFAKKLRIVLVLMVTFGVPALAEESEALESNRISSENEDFESRNDYPDMDDLSSFFDFDLVPSSESDGEYTNRYSSAGSNSESSGGRRRRNKYYYYYKADGPRYPFDLYPPKKQLVTPGTHYKPEIDKDIVENVNESKPTLNQAVVGPYQVSVVDADSPLLSNLGLNKDDLMKLSGHTKRSTTNASMEGSDSIPPATYAENPRQDHPPPNYAPSSSHPHHPPHEPSSHYSGGHPERSYRPNDYYPAENPPPHRGYSSGQPPPQGSYDPKSYHSSPQSPSTYNYPPPPPPPYSQYPPPASSYAPKRSSDVPWRQVPSAHTDWDDKQARKPEPYHGYSHYQPPTHNSSPSRPSYSSSAEKPGYRYSPSYSKPPPTYSSPASSSSSDYHSHKHSSSSASDYHSHKHSAPTSGDYNSYKHSQPSSSDYHSHKPSYSSPGYSSSAKAPSRAGSVGYSSSQHSHETSKPGITIRFKAKAGSGHGSSGSGHGGSGLSIPLNFNPLDVVKKLIPSLNPLNNKKVTIGITIENKKEPHIDIQSY